MILQYYNCEWKQLNFWGTWNSLKTIMVAFTLLECAFKILFFFFFGQNFSHLLQLHVSSTEERIKGLSLCNLTHEDWNHSQDSFLHPFKKKFCGLFQWRKIVDKKQVSLMWSQLSKKKDIWSPTSVNYWNQVRGSFFTGTNQHFLRNHLTQNLPPDTTRLFF